MAQNPSVAGSAPLTYLGLPSLKDIWQGGPFGFSDPEVNGAKRGYFSALGHMNPTGGGASMQTKIKSAEFISLLPSGQTYVEGEPVQQIDPVTQVKINAASIRTVGKALFSSDPTTQTQAAIATDTVKLFTAIVLDVWYFIGKEKLTQWIVSKVAAGIFTDKTQGTDYLIDSDTGGILFLSTGSLVAGEDVSVLFQCAAITNAPVIAPGSQPQYTYAGLRIYLLDAVNEARNTAELWLRYIPRARIKPTGNFDWSADKPAEITLDIMPVNSNEIAGQPFGYFRQLGGTMRLIA